MSHEIRTPLNAIVGFSELLTETDDAEEKFEYKQLIETNSEILLKLIGDILDLSKIEVGSIDINRQKLNLCQLCDELYRSFQQRIKNPKVILKLINPYTKCVANFDKYRFMQIFTNFATNAIKYTPQGEIVMGYECMPGQVRIYVKDSGIGIPEEKKNRIFSRFEKLDTFAQGTGLGLSICKAIADATGGEVGFKSKANIGSEFWYIGYTDVEYVEKSEVADEDLNNKSTEHLSANSSVKIKDLNILIAEDNDSNYLLIKKLLKDNQLTRTITGVEAIEKIKAQTFDIVFMDFPHPGIQPDYPYYRPYCQCIRLRQRECISRRMQSFHDQARQKTRINGFTFQIFQTTTPITGLFLIQFTYHFSRISHSQRVCRNIMRNH